MGEAIEIVKGQEYVSTSDGKTRKIISVNGGVVFVCLDCVTIASDKQASMSYEDFERCIKGKIFTLKISEQAADTPRQAEAREMLDKIDNGVKAYHDEISEKPKPQNPTPSLFD